MAPHNSPPSTLNVNVADDVAIREGELAATRMVRGAHLSDQLKVGVALSVLSRAAMSETGSNARMGRPYNEAFSRQLAKHPKLEAVYGHTRAAALWCVENWADTQAYLARLEKEDPVKLQVLGVRGLKEKIEREIAVAQRAVEMLEPHEPTPPRRTTADQLNDVLLALRDAGLRFEDGAIEITDLRSYRGWQKYQRDKATEIAKLEDEPDAPETSGDDQLF
jgi:hypothetical protein